MKLTNVECKKVAENISNPMYSNNLQATKELIELFNKISRKPLKTAEDYVKFYADNFYTLLILEARQSFGLMVETNMPVGKGCGCKL